MGRSKQLKSERVGEERLDKNGCLMRIIEYNSTSDITVEFQDEHKGVNHGSYDRFLKGTIQNPYTTLKYTRIGEIEKNNNGELMKIIEYNDASSILVEFQDEYKNIVRTSYSNFKRGLVANKKERRGAENINSQGCLMMVIEYNKYSDVVVEFQDDYGTKIHTTWDRFKNGSCRNPRYPTVCGVGFTSDKHPAKINNEYTKEYRVWQNMLCRCYTDVHETYDEVTCSDEWLVFDNFYDWLHSQSNFEKWLNGDRWCLDKDILVKGNKVYSPETCCLVSFDVNILFAKRKKSRGDLPIGVSFEKNTGKYRAHCWKRINDEPIKFPRRDTPEEAFYDYKKYKEWLIKQIAKDEFLKENITEECYNAMMNYIVEITD